MPDLGGSPALSKVIVRDVSKTMDLPGKLFKKNFFLINKTIVKMLQFLKFKFIFLKSSNYSCLVADPSVDRLLTRASGEAAL